MNKRKTILLLAITCLGLSARAQTNTNTTFHYSVVCMLPVAKSDALRAKLNKDVSDATNNVVPEPTVTASTAQAAVNDGYKKGFLEGFKAGARANEKRHRDEQLDADMPTVEQKDAETFQKSFPK